MQSQGSAKPGTRRCITARSNAAAKRSEEMLPLIRELNAKGAVSLQEIAAGLNAAGLQTLRGSPWTVIQVRRLLVAHTYIQEQTE